MWVAVFEVVTIFVVSVYFFAHSDKFFALKCIIVFTKVIIIQFKNDESAFFTLFNQWGPK